MALKEFPDEAVDIDPQLALEMLPGKIADRRRIITSQALDISCLREIENYDKTELATLVVQLNGQKQLLAIYENRLERVKRAVNGTE